MFRNRLLMASILAFLVDSLPLCTYPPLPGSSASPRWFPQHHTGPCVLWHSPLELCAYRCPSALANRLLGGHVSLVPCCYSAVVNGGGKDLPYEVYRLPGMCQRKWVTSPLDPGFSQAYLSVCLTSNFSHQRWFFVRGERQELLFGYSPVLLSKILLPPSVIKKRKILTEWE